YRLRCKRVLSHKSDFKQSQLDILLEISILITKRQIVYYKSQPTHTPRRLPEWVPAFAGMTTIEKTLQDN
ncbi:hypothetical protein ABTK01_20135, partial [Acinetobacter baumannii]